jgi:hypothetical protein
MVSATSAWLCSRGASDIRGRQFVIRGNRVSLRYPAVYRIADNDDVKPCWTPDGIGQKIRESMKDWPQATNVPDSPSRRSASSGFSRPRQVVARFRSRFSLRIRFGASLFGRSWAERMS